MFSELLRGLRAKKGLSQKRLAEIVGVSPGNVSDWESGKAKPGYVALAALSRCFDVSSDYLLELEPEKTGDNETQHLDRAEKARGLLYDGSPLTDEETDLIAMYRFLPDHKKEDAFDIIHTLYQRHVERKKDSIYWTYKEDKLKQQEKADSSENSRGGIA